MNRRSILIVAVFVAFVAPILFAGGQGESVDAETVELEFWTPTDVEMYKEWIAEFEEANPGVSINVVSHPWNDYWTKLPLALQSGDGPDIFYQHIAFLENTVPHAAPYDPELMDYDTLKEEFDLIEANMIDGNVYYVPLATMTGSIFYNRDILAEAGVSEVPARWDDFISLAQDLTVTNDAGQVRRAGFSYNGMARDLNWALNYQKGLPIFNQEGKATIAHPKARETVAFLQDLYKEEQVGSFLLGGNAWDQLANGQAAMVYVYGWVYGWMRENGPDVDFGVAPIPTFEPNPPAYDRNNVELMIGVSKYADEERAAVGQEFINYILNNKYFLIDYAVRKGAIPTKLELRDEPAITSHPLFSVVQEIIDRTVYPGAFPVAIEPGYNRLFENVLLNDMPISEAVEIAEKEINQAVEDTGFEPKEELYEHYNEFDY